MSFLRTLLPIALLASQAVAQTSTDCNPRNTTSCPADPALSTTYTNDYNNSAQNELDPGFWTVTGANLMSYTADGVELTVTQKGQSITAQSLFYIMWGRVEIMFQAAKGTGIISSSVLLSDDLDEIDFEIMGGNNSFAETNFYGVGNYTHATYVPVDNITGQMHNYTVDWRQEQTNWYIDGQLVRTLPYNESGYYPQTPCFVKFGIWAGGDSNQPGTVAWAGGKTDWSQGPFTMKIQSIKVTDGGTNTSSYTWGTHNGDAASGSYQNINSTPGESKFVQLLNKKTTSQAAIDKFNGLSMGAKIGIAAGVGAGLLIAIIAFTVFCIKQRRAGKREKALADQSWNEQAAELMSYRQRMAHGQFAVSHMGHGEKY